MVSEESVKKFIERVDSEGRSEDECWPWTGSFAQSSPYFNFDGKSVSALQFMYVLEVGHVDEDERVVRACGTETCINPHHLVKMTQKEFQEEHLDNSNFTDEEVRNIRQRYATEEGVTYREIAADEDVWAATIREIVMGETYEDAGGPIKGEDYDVVDQEHRFGRGGPTKLSESKVAKMRRRYVNEEETTYAQIAEDFEVSEVTAYRAVVGKTWRDAPGPIPDSE